MFRLLNKLFIRNFYQSNAGFFLFFFFIFFGAVQGGSLVGYHLSLMKSILGSWVTLLVVSCCWLLYHLKCFFFVLRIINSEEGRFLHTLQALPSAKQWRSCLFIYFCLYIPVLLYAILLAVVGFRWGDDASAWAIVTFQLLSLFVFSFFLFRRLNDWLRKPFRFRWPFSLPNSFVFYNVVYFTTQKRLLFLVLKSFSLLLLYLSLVWNRDRYTHDSFLLLYLLMLMAHALVPYLSVQFLERQASFIRNLPLSLAKPAAFYIASYLLLLLPEACYIFYQATAFSIEHRLAYAANAVSSLCLLTAIQYADAVDRNEYLKAAFGLFFFSVFALHAQAFWAWIAIQLTVAGILFIHGYYRFETD